LQVVSCWLGGVEVPVGLGRLRLVPESGEGPWRGEGCGWFFDCAPRGEAARCFAQDDGLPNTEQDGLPNNHWDDGSCNHRLVTVSGME